MAWQVWNLLPGEGGAAVKQLLEVRLEEEALRTYVTTVGELECLIALIDLLID